MSGQWREAVRRGELSLDVLTARRVLEAGYELPSGWGYLGVVYPDGADALPIAFRDAARVSSWCEEMRPCELRVLVADGEDELALRRALGADVRLH